MIHYGGPLKIRSGPLFFVSLTFCKIDVCLCYNYKILKSSELFSGDFDEPDRRPTFRITQISRIKQIS